MEFPRQEYYSGLSFPSPGDLLTQVSPVFMWILYHWAIKEASIAVIYEGYVLLPQRTLHILTFHFYYKQVMCHSHGTDKKADGQSSKSDLPEVKELEIKADFELRSALSPKSVS